ncbi:MAG: hypothetical protein ACREQY_15940 [Candidatus Binatia bacterium]
MTTPFRSARSAILTALVALTLASSAFGFSDSYRLYTIEGYLDRAPSGATIIDRVEIAATGEPPRELLVTVYQSPGEMLLDRYLSRQVESRYPVRGKPDYVSRLLDSPEGTEIKGTFVLYPHAIPSLLIAQLDRPA